MPGIAFFDFDGTITTRDTLLDFHRFAFGSIPAIWGMIRCSRHIFSHKLGFTGSKKAKESILSYFWKGKPREALSSLGQKYSARISEIVRPKALEAINFHQNLGDTLVIVTASVYEWVAPWALSNGFDAVIASQTEDNDTILTGKIRGENCNGREKVRRINEIYNLSEFVSIYAYGDSRGDADMLQIADKNSRFFRWRNEG